MPGYKFLLGKGVKREYLNLLGMFYAGKQTALQLASNHNLTPCQILIRFTVLLSMSENALILDRADAHPWTYRSDQSGLVPDKQHFTMDIKDSAMIHNSTHLTVHAYLRVNSNTHDITNMWDVDFVVPKRDANDVLKVEKDAYFDSRKNMQVNNWNMTNLQEFDEPEELSRVRLGDKFVTVLPLDHDHKAKTTQEAVEEERRVRESLEEEGKELLDKK